MGTILDGFVLRDAGLSGPDKDGSPCSGVNRHVGAAGGFTDDLGECGALFCLAGDGGDAKEFASRLTEEIGETDGVVNIRADVRVEEDGNAMRHSVTLSTGCFDPRAYHTRKG